MPKQSAGILLFKTINRQLYVFLVHPGGPFFAKKDTGAWSIPKGEFDNNENALLAAQREFREETGFSVEGNFIPLEPVKLKSGKLIYAWAIEGNIQEDIIISNTFDLEWPPKSGKTKNFPEIDKAAWLSMKKAKEKINPAQVALLENLERIIGK